MENILKVFMKEFPVGYLETFLEKAVDELLKKSQYEFKKKGEKCLKKNLDDEFLKQFFGQILKGSLEDVFIHTGTQKRNEKHTKITFFYH